MNLDGTNKTKIVPTDVPSPVGLALDIGAGKIYWARDKAADHAILRANFDGTGKELVAQYGTMTSIRDIIIDPERNRFYASSGATNYRRIFAGNLDGTDVRLINEQITTGSNPMGLALNEAGDKLYVATPGYKTFSGSISRIPALNRNKSSDSEGIIENSIGNDPRPRYMVVEHNTGKLFWTDFGKQGVYSANTDGTGITALVTSSQDQFLLIPWGVAVDRRNNSKPKFPATAISIAENTTAVSSAIATDDESPRDSVTCSVEGGADKDLFTLNTSTCQLTFKTAPDFETPTDADKKNTYVIILKATSGKGYWALSSKNTTITVTVTDANEAPSFTEGDTATRSVAENSAAASVGTAVTATDPDAGATFTR